MTNTLASVSTSPLQVMNSELTAPPIGSPTLWFVSIAVVLVLVALDFVLTRRPHEVSLREAAGWSAFYVALPLAFGAWIWTTYGSQRGVEFLSGYIVEKSLSVDNLFVFMLLLAAFAVPPALQQRVLLFGIVGALVLRGIFIALGAAALERFSITFLIFGLILVATAVKVWRDAQHGGHTADVSQMRSIRLIRRLFPVTEKYEGARMFSRVDGRLALTPLAVATAAVLATDVVFAVDSVPAVYGITDEPYLVFATNAFALLGLRALYFLLSDVLGRLVHLGFGLALILAFIGVKLVLHWAHKIWPSTPEVPTALSLVIIVGILVAVTISSLVVTRGRAAASSHADDHTDGSHPASGPDAAARAAAQGVTAQGVAVGASDVQDHPEGPGRA